MYAWWGKRAMGVASIVAVLAIAGTYRSRRGTDYGSDATIPMWPPLTPKEIAQAGPIEPWWEPTPDQQTYARQSGLPVACVNTLGQRLVLIPPGSIAMRPLTEGAGSEGSARSNSVNITRGFYLATAEVTRAEFEAYWRWGPSSEGSAVSDDRESNQVSQPIARGLDSPVSEVSWLQAQEFCLWLTRRERDAGLLPIHEAYALPTEAQWEYACRGCRTMPETPGPDRRQAQEHLTVETHNAVAGTIAGGLNQPPEGRKQSGHPGADKRPSPWGLYDMHGHFGEWTRSLWFPYPYVATDGRELPADSLSAAYGSAVHRHRLVFGDSAAFKCVIRGMGSGTSLEEEAVCGARHGDWPTRKLDGVGFRIARVISEPPSSD